MKTNKIEEVKTLKKKSEMVQAKANPSPRNNDAR
jgi:hypothetical protein